MVVISVLNLIVVLVVVAIIAIPIVKILRQAGYSGWWTILWFVPLVNLVVLWVFAFSRWPAVRRAQTT
ncbi:MAG: hypothetical protein KGL11_00145 [Alphaproteobacteria bacterium]|nr:hypothetical protein [Alphaproteobacteria bacterium]